MKPDMYSKVRSSDYDQISAGDEPSELDLAEGEKLFAATTRTYSKQPWSRWPRLAGLICAGVVSVLLIFALGFMSGYDQGSQLSSTSSTSESLTSSTKIGAANCTEPYFRREWRSLAVKEKKDYLDAVQCFIDSPSMLNMNGSLYDDFSWVHNLVAHSTHGKALFLSWHRRFIFVYEKTLHEKCGYNGALPFWDWSLDWEDPSSSPIFDSKLGFGGDGDRNATKHGTAYCVTDTPFKNLKPKWYGELYDPHCLTRWFVDKDDWFARYLGPSALQLVMNSSSYDEFFRALENGPHDIIPGGIRGDFSSFTAPNDPIFYLHHSQLDRVWWLWQTRDKENRVKDYGGEGDIHNGTLSDVLSLAGLDKDLTVADIMDTEAGGMCYRYMYV